MRYCRKCRGRGRCTCGVPTGAFVTETVNKVITLPQQGVQGETGDKLVFMYQLSAQDTTPPSIANVVNPAGWSSTPLQTTDALPYRWVSQGYVNSDGTVLTVNWSVPTVDLENEALAPESDDEIFSI